MDAGFRGGERDVFTLFENEVIDLAVEDAPDDVLADAVAAVDVELGVEVIAGGGSGDFCNQFGGTFDIPFGINARLTATSFENAKISVRLGHVVEVEAKGPVVAAGHAWRCGAICAQPSDQVEVRLTVCIVGYWRRHVDHPFDEFCLSEVWRRVVTSLKFGARESIAGLERRNA